ncbi:hypothetical protein SNE40_011275 [Patella caerulea]|uniref:Transmembrane protein 53 n=1 Tax=Patella caerulea TaxID=87958 RepID=A0AAN8JN98_PATCE
MSDNIKCIFTYPISTTDDEIDNFSVIETADLHEKRPVIVLLGWAGCLDKHLAKYSAIYEQKRYITVRCICPTSVLFFNHGKLAGLSRELLQSLYDKKLSQHPIFFHIFSNGGCYVYCNISKLLHGSDEYRSLNVHGCIFDSAPGKRRFLKATKAFMATLRVNIVFKYLLGFCCMIFLVVSYVYTLLLQTQTKSKNAFLLYEGIAHDEGRWPEMFLYSKADETIYHTDIEEIIDYRKKAGVNVFSTCWDDSPHVKHFPRHKEVYTTLCHQFINTCLNYNKS